MTESEQPPPTAPDRLGAPSASPVESADTGRGNASYTNANVTESMLASPDSIEYAPLDPRFAQVTAILTILLELGIATAMGIIAFARQDHWQLDLSASSIVAATAIAVIVIGLPILRFRIARAIQYGVREHDIALRSGLFWRRELIQPISRIQHIELEPGPIEKRVGLATLSLFSAGSAGATFTIPGLPLARAARVRRFVLQRLQR